MRKFKKVATKDAETITEAEILAPCETGTEVHLSGIIWHETDGNIINDRNINGPKGPVRFCHFSKLI